MDYSLVVTSMRERHTMRKYSTQSPPSLGQFLRPLWRSCLAVVGFELPSNSLQAVLNQARQAIMVTVPISQYAVLTVQDRAL